MTTTSRLRLLTLTLTAATALASAGCSSASDSEPAEEDVGAESAALSHNGVCDMNDLVTPQCSFLAFGIAWNAPVGPRRTMIERGLRWLDMGVPYSKYRSTDGYRQDCSGSVSMEWELGASPTTWQFAPYGHAYSYRLGSLDDLEPGDALNRVSPRGHIVLFAQWGDETHQSFFVLEEAAPGHLMQIRTMSRADARHYAPIRKNGL